MNKRIFFGGASILAAFAMMGASTFAFFNSTATSTNNVFASGTLKLALCDGNETCPADANATQNVTASFGMNNMKPGDCTGNQTLSLKNTGSIDAGNVTINATNDNSTFAPWLRINSLTYDSGVQSVGNPNANGWSDLADFQTSGLSGLSGITANTTKNLVMDVCLDQSAPNDVQGMSDTLNLTVTLNQ